ncbi:MAG: hypothetical protein HOB51_02370 [Thaumarchaeota archaeon]|nr:hypothetical protein [Nitrososphaerota archaeon]
MSRQMDHLMDEEIQLNFEIIDTLKILVQQTQWDSNNLKMKLEGLISQHDIIDSELYEIGFYDKPSKEVKG